MYRLKQFVFSFALLCGLFSCNSSQTKLDVKYFYDQFRDSSPETADSLFQTIAQSELSFEDQKWRELLGLFIQSKKDSACLQDEFIKILKDEQKGSIVQQENFSFILNAALSQACKDWEEKVIGRHLTLEDDGGWANGYPFLKVIYASYWRENGDLEKARDLYDSAQKEFEKRSLLTSVQRINYYLGLLELEAKNGEKAKERFQNVLVNKEAKKDTFLYVYALSKYARILGNTEDYEKAIDVALECKKIAEESNQKLLLSKAYGTLGSVYYSSGDYEKSLMNTQLRVELEKEIGTPSKYATALNSLGITLNEMDRWDEAKEKFSKALKIRRSIANSKASSIALIEMNIGAIHIEKGSLDSAEIYFEKAISSDSKLSEKLSYNVDLAKLYFLQNRGIVAKKQLEKADKLAQSENNLFKRKYNLESLKTYHLESGNLKEYVESDMVYDEIYSLWQNEEKAKQVARFQAEYNHEKQNRTIEFLEIDQKLKDIKLKEENRAKWFWGSLALSVLALSFVLVRLWYQQKKAKELTEKMMKELHHRVKNNLEMLSGMFSLQAMQAENEAVRLSITENEARVTAMNLIHSKLYQESEQLIVNLNDYLEEIIDNLKDVYAGELELNIDARFPNFKINVDKAITLGLLVNELFTNAFKYADPEGNHLKLFIEYAVEDNFLKILTISDNGKEFKMIDEQGFGSKLIGLLSRQLKADYQSKWDKGYQQRFEFKKLKGA